MAQTNEDENKQQAGDEDTKILPDEENPQSDPENIVLVNKVDHLTQEDGSTLNDLKTRNQSSNPEKILPEQQHPGRDDSGDVTTTESFPGAVRVAGTAGYHQESVDSVDLEEPERAPDASLAPGGPETVMARTVDEEAIMKQARQSVIAGAVRAEELDDQAMKFGNWRKWAALPLFVAVIVLSVGLGVGLSNRAEKTPKTETRIQATITADSEDLIKRLTATRYVSPLSF